MPLRKAVGLLAAPAPKHTGRGKLQATVLPPATDPDPTDHAQAQIR